MSSKCTGNCVNIRNINKNRGYPSGHQNHRGGERTGSSASSKDIKTRGRLQQPHMTLDGISITDLPGWYVPADKDLAKGDHPRFLMLSSDSLECKLVKQKINDTIAYVFDTSEQSGLAAAAEALRLKKEVSDAVDDYQKACNPALYWDQFYEQRD